MKRKLTLILIVLNIISLKLSAQQSVTSSEAYDKAQAARSKARHLYNKDNPSQSDVQQSILILKNTIKYLDSLPIRELEQGNIFLKGRAHDVYLDLVTANLIAHNNDGALDALEKMCDQGSYFFADMLQTDSLYLPIRSNPRFSAVINKLKNREKLWKDEALKTPLTVNLTSSEKVAGLSLLWSQAKYNFANFDHADIDWDKVYLEYLPLVTATENNIEYYKLLQKFYAQLKDGHTNVYN